jgi:hypothetical protein
VGILPPSHKNLVGEGGDHGANGLCAFPLQPVACALKHPDRQIWRQGPMAFSQAGQKRLVLIAPEKFYRTGYRSRR